ncbi:MAG: hypothetical protein R3F61_04170 [Myxococcota bacterium]
MTRAEQLRAKREAMRARLAERRRARPAKRRPSRGWILVIVVLILLFLLRDCSCSPPPPECEPGPVPECGPAEPEEVEAPLPNERIPRRARPPFAGQDPAKLPWIDAFRMQVAARSPRLGACFIGADRPGTLRWTTFVEPVEGKVSEHELEPMLLTDDITAQERACVLAVLTEPAYTLPVDETRSTPSRVGLVLEF